MKHPMTVATKLFAGALLATLCSLASAQVTYQRLVDADKTPEDWLTYSGAYHSQRFSALKQIDKSNVAQLRPTWTYQVQRGGLIEASPIVADGVMYVTEPPSTVSALDVRTGKRLWTWSPEMPQDVFAPARFLVNRGVAVLDDTVFVGTMDAQMVALDAKTGAVRWNVKVGDNKMGYGITSAPLALKDKIVVGIGGAEAGIRGFIDAYDPKTGKLAWRTYTIPAPGEPGAETWSKTDSWKTGGGSTWTTGSYDPELNLLYWGVGNPGPDYNGDVRPGDNLYTNCLLALDPATGKIKWHFQFTPHDTHDWDATEIAVLFNAKIDGKDRKLVAMANRNAFYYVIDRVTGKYITAMPYARQNWADGLDANGRPILKPNMDPNDKGVLVYPHWAGAANWHSPAYSPITQMLYQNTREMGSVMKKGDGKFVPGKLYEGGSFEPIIDERDAFGAVRALEATTGKTKWEFKISSPPLAGVLATAGGLVFSGTNEGNFFALDADNGKPLWDFNVGGAIRANPIAYAVDGKEYVMISAGTTMFVFALP
jgi:alcohol dehydrogenase (cytochrome c)